MCPQLAETSALLFGIGGCTIGIWTPHFLFFLNRKYQSHSDGENCAPQEPESVLI
jgi:hypothetical protein